MVEQELGSVFLGVSFFYSILGDGKCSDVALSQLLTIRINTFGNVKARLFSPLILTKQRCLSNYICQRNTLYIPK